MNEIEYRVYKDEWGQYILYFNVDHLSHLYKTFSLPENVILLIIKNINKCFSSIYFVPGINHVSVRFSFDGSSDPDYFFMTLGFCGTTLKIKKEKLLTDYMIHLLE